MSLAEVQISKDTPMEDDQLLLSNTMKHSEKVVITEVVPDEPTLDSSIHNYNSWISQFQKDMNNSIPGDLYRTLLHSFQQAYFGSDISMIPMYHLFTHDKELSGVYLCVELGGSTLRAGVVDFSKKEVLVVQESWVLEEDEKVINEQFFKALVSRCLLIEEFGMLLGPDHMQKTARMAVTWSFPTDLERRIITMGKGWKINDNVKRIPIKQSIQKAFKDEGFDVIVRNVINDSVGTALAGLSKGQLPMSLILGTGVNVCLLQQDQLLNTELGFFGGLAVPTKYDLMIDERWMTFGEEAWRRNDDQRIYQPFEMITGGRYLCELLRLVLMDLSRDDDTFPRIPYGQYQLQGELFCVFSQQYDNIQDDLLTKFSLSFTLDQIELIQSIVECIITRSSHYIIQAIHAMYQFSTGHSATRGTVIPVTYTGSFLHHCQLYQDKISEDSGIQLKFIADSSLIGAAVAASL